MNHVLIRFVSFGSVLCGKNALVQKTVFVDLIQITPTTNESLIYTMFDVQEYLMFKCIVWIVRLKINIEIMELQVLLLMWVCSFSQCYIQLEIASPGTVENPDNIMKCELKIWCAILLHWKHWLTTIHSHGIVEANKPCIWGKDISIHMGERHWKMYWWG